MLSDSATKLFYAFYQKPEINLFFTIGLTCCWCTLADTYSWIPPAPAVPVKTHSSELGFIIDLFSKWAVFKKGLATE
jgi:hypothetical protein